MSENPTPPSGPISTMRLADLKEVAASMGLELPSKSRRPDYIAAIREARGAGSKPAPVKEPAKSDQHGDPTEQLELPDAKPQKDSGTELSDEEKKAALDALGEAAERRAEERTDDDENPRSRRNRSRRNRNRNRDDRQDRSDRQVTR